MREGIRERPKAVLDEELERFIEIGKAAAESAGAVARRSATLREERLSDLDRWARIYRLAPIGGIGYALLSGTLPPYPLDPNAWKLMRAAHPEESAYRLDGAAVGMAVGR